MAACCVALAGGRCRPRRGRGLHSRGTRICAYRLALSYAHVVSSLPDGSVRVVPRQLVDMSVHNTKKRHGALLGPEGNLEYRGAWEALSHTTTHPGPAPAAPVLCLV